MYAHERRAVAMVDIHGSFITLDMEKWVIIVMQEILVELMVKIIPRIYKKFVTIENGQTVLYVK